MKVGILVTTLSNGGAEKIASNLSVLLPSDIDFFYILNKPQQSFPYKGELYILDNILNHKFTSIRLYNIIKKFLYIRSILKKEQPDFVVCMSPTLIHFTVGISSKKIIAVLHNNYSLKKIKFINKIKMMYGYHHAKSIVAVSHGVKKDAQQFFLIKKNIIVIHNATSFNNDIVKNVLIPPQWRETLLNWKKNNYKICLNIGRLESVKGQKNLIRVFADIKKNSNCKLIIIGSGSQKHYLLALVRTLSLDNDVLIIDFQEDLSPFYDFCDIFVFSSFYEGFGMVLIEALAFGLPVISTDCSSGPREILSPDSDIFTKTKCVELATYGILTPVFEGPIESDTEPLSMAEHYFSTAIQMLISDNLLRRHYETQAKLRATDFDTNIWVKKWYELFSVNL
jgi:N-acetylgalactosamine-N,N'-diacetylbacillosaminyl-diphospho-undecaprenol 4-alpha-N-acetylgalactosaminyltransferase